MTDEIDEARMARFLIVGRMFQHALEEAELLGDFAASDTFKNELASLIAAAATSVPDEDAGQGSSKSER